MLQFCVRQRGVCSGRVSRRATAGRSAPHARSMAQLVASRLSDDTLLDARAWSDVASAGGRDVAGFAVRLVLVTSLARLRIVPIVPVARVQSEEQELGWNLLQQASGYAGPGLRVGRRTSRAPRSPKSTLGTSPGFGASTRLFSDCIILGGVGKGLTNGRVPTGVCRFPVLRGGPGHL
jgi:hypothetical protein